MAIQTAYTKAEAEEMLALWKACEKALASGQAKTYRIGTREFTSVDSKFISDRILYFTNVVESLSGTVRTSRVTRIVPRDL